jgi:hypothetical protein
LLQSLFKKELESAGRRDSMPSDLVAGAASATSVQVRSQRVVLKEPDLARIECSATLELEPTELGRALLKSDLLLWKLSTIRELRRVEISDGRASSEVHYSAQLSEDRKQLVVEAYGHEPLATLAVILYGIEWIEANRASSDDGRAERSESSK